MSLLDEMFQITDEQKAKAATEKIKPLLEYIFKECERQNYTLYELEKLILAMAAALEWTKQELCDKTPCFSEKIQRKE